MSDTTLPSETARLPFRAALPFWLSLLMIPLVLSGALFGGVWVAVPILATWGVFELLDAALGLVELQGPLELLRVGESGVEPERACDLVVDGDREALREARLRQYAGRQHCGDQVGEIVASQLGRGVHREQRAGLDVGARQADHRLALAIRRE